MGVGAGRGSKSGSRSTRGSSRAALALRSPEVQIGWHGDRSALVRTSGSWPRRELRLSGVRLPPHPQWTGRMACAIHAKAQETNGTAAEAQGDIPPPPIPTSEPGDPVDQPDTTRLGQLLHGGTLQRVLSLRSNLGGKEGPAPHDEGSETKGLRLDAVE